jgi:hypothetical protein
MAQRRGLPPHPEDRSPGAVTIDFRDPVDRGASAGVKLHGLKARVLARGLILTLGLIGSSQAIAGTPAKPFFVSVQPLAGLAIPFAGDGGVHVAYRLLLTSYEKEPLRIVTYGVKSVDRSCPDFARQYRGKALDAIFNGAGNPARTAPQAPLLESGRSATLFVFLDLAAGHCVPSAFSHTLDIQEGDSQEGDSQEGDSIDTRQTLHAPDTVVSTRKAQIISPPLRGKNWWTPNGPANDSIHRRSLIVLAGTVYFPEEYAVDWIRLGSDGAGFSGDPSSNASYFAYRSPIYAVADGTVVSARDGIPENTPVQDQPLKPAVPITLDTIAGNNVVEDLGDGVFALYAHLIPETLKVSTGQTIRRGDLLGELGNSGNSTEPHLHFQLMDAPAALQANGVPFVFDSWSRMDYKIIRDKNGKPTSFSVGAIHPVTGQSFMNLDLGSF